MSEKRILALGEKYGFASSPRAGFIGMERNAPQGVQRLDVFVWSNKKLAEVAGIPWSYAVVDIDGARYRLPLVEWPSQTQPRRPWAQVEAEFDEAFGPLLAPTSEGSQAHRESLSANPRYRLD